MTTKPPFGSPEWERQTQEALVQAFREFDESMSQVGRIFAAQGTMGWAYRGDIENTRVALAVMTPDQLREVSAAATLLATLADEELGSR